MLAMVVGAFAQKEIGTFTVYPRLGVNMYKLSGAPISTSVSNEVDADYKAGFIAGAEMQYQCSSSFAVSAGVMYSSQGAKWELGDMSYKNTLHYVNVPVMAVGFLGNSGVSLKVGVQVGFLASARYETEGFDITKDEDGNTINAEYYSESGSANGAFDKVDFSIPVGVSYEYRNIALDLRYSFGINKIDKYIDSGRNRGFFLSLGYGLDL